MGRHRFFIVDVFAEEKYAGNPLAVVACERPIPDSEELADFLVADMRLLMVETVRILKKEILEERHKRPTASSG